MKITVFYTGIELRFCVIIYHKKCKRENCLDNTYILKEKNMRRDCCGNRWLRVLLRVHMRTNCRAELIVD